MASIVLFTLSGLEITEVPSILTAKDFSSFRSAWRSASRCARCAASSLSRSSAACCLARIAACRCSSASLQVQFVGVSLVLCLLHCQLWFAVFCSPLLSQGCSLLLFHTFPAGKRTGENVMLCMLCCQHSVSVFLPIFCRLLPGPSRKLSLPFSFFQFACIGTSHMLCMLCSPMLCMLCSHMLCMMCSPMLCMLCCQRSCPYSCRLLLG